MKFLDLEILNPNDQAEDYNEEKSIQKIKELYDKYKNYLEECRTKISKKSKAFLDLYEKTGWFHDYEILSMDFHPKTRLFKEKKDTMILKLRDKDEDNKVILLTLKDILRYKLDFDQLHVPNQFRGFNGFGIDKFEIGFEFDYSFINIAIPDTEINIYFKQLDFKIEKIEA